MFQKVFHSRILIILFAIILLAISPVYAKGLGVKAGIAFADQIYKSDNGDSWADTKYRTGLAIGLFREFILSPAISIHGEALYVQKGFEIDGLILLDDENHTLQTVEQQNRIDILSLSILAKAALPSGTYIIGGPRLDVEVGSDYEHQSMNALKNVFASPIFGLSLGIGQELTFMPWPGLFIEGMYYHDIGDLYKRQGITTDVSTLESVKNKAFSVVMGVKF